MELLFAILGAVLGAGIVGLLVRAGIDQAVKLSDKTDNKIDDAAVKLLSEKEEELTEFIRAELQKLLDKQKEKK